LSQCNAAGALSRDDKGRAPIGSECIARTAFIKLGGSAADYPGLGAPAPLMPPAPNFAACGDQTRNKFPIIAAQYLGILGAVKAAQTILDSSKNTCIADLQATVDSSWTKLKESRNAETLFKAQYNRFFQASRSTSEVNNRIIGLSAEAKQKYFSLESNPNYFHSRYFQNCSVPHQILDRQGNPHIGAECMARKILYLLGKSVDSFSWDVAPKVPENLAPETCLQVSNDQLFRDIPVYPTKVSVLAEVAPEMESALSGCETADRQVKFAELYKRVWDLAQAPAEKTFATLFVSKRQSLAESSIFSEFAGSKNPAVKAAYTTLAGKVNLSKTFIECQTAFGTITDADGKTYFGANCLLRQLMADYGVNIHRTDPTSQPPAVAPDRSLAQCLTERSSTNSAMIDGYQAAQEALATISDIYNASRKSCEESLEAKVETAWKKLQQLAASDTESALQRLNAKAKTHHSGKLSSLMGTISSGGTDPAKAGYNLLATATEGLGIWNCTSADGTPLPPPPGSLAIGVDCLKQSLASISGLNPATGLKFDQPPKFTKPNTDALCLSSLNHPVWKTIDEFAGLSSPLGVIETEYGKSENLCSSNAKVQTRIAGLVQKVASMRDSPEELELRQAMQKQPNITVPQFWRALQDVPSNADAFLQFQQTGLLDSLYRYCSLAYGGGVDPATEKSYVGSQCLLRRIWLAYFAANRDQVHSVGFDATKSEWAFGGFANLPSCIATEASARAFEQQIETFNTNKALLKTLLDNQKNVLAH
jgi:hypothetical protein